MNRRAPLRRSAPALAALALLLLAPRAAPANMADPMEVLRGRARPGALFTEPAGGTRVIAVERETLVLDLRPVEDGKPAVVEATYHLRNDAAAQTLNLVFVADALADGGRVWLDGRRVPSTTRSADGLPPERRAPTRAPAADGGAPVPYAQATGALAFRLVVEPGRHTVRVRYRADPALSADDEPQHSLGYVLAPVRAWKEFGRLDLRVELPAGRPASAEPALRRRGDALVGSWAGLPADRLAVSVEARPSDFDEPAGIGAWVGAGLVLGALVWVGRQAIRLGRAVAVGTRSRGSAVLGCLGCGAALGLAWAVASFGVGGYGYGILLGLLAAPVVALIGALVAGVAALLVAWRGRPFPRGAGR